jgi:polar amino acid transport system substrate-binding protein
MFSGLDIEVARAVCDVLGVEFRIIEHDAWELITAVRYGRADLAVGWLPSEGEEHQIHISEPYAVAEHVVIVRR